MIRSIAFALLAVLSLTTLPAAAQTADQAFSVSGVEVDVTAADAMRAREKAFADVQRLAFRRLMDRLVAEGQPRVPEPAARDIEAMVKDVIVESEKASAVRYLATFTVRFKPDSIRGLLSGAGVAYVDSRRPPVVVVPVLAAEEGPLLWDDPNPWREAWSRRPADGLVPFIVPVGELKDVTLVNAKQAMARDANALAALARQYGAVDALVTVASVAPGPDTLPVVTVKSYGVGPAAPQGTTVKVAGKSGEPLPALLRRAADQVADAVASGHKQLAAVPAGEEAGPISALVPVASMQDWLAVRQRLSALPLIKRVEVISLSRNEAAVVLHAVGAMPQVEQVLTQAGFTLSQEGGPLIIRPGFGGAPR